MQIIQRVFLVLTVIIFLGAAIVLPAMEQETILQNQWESVQTEQFMNRICKNQECTYEEYMLLHAALNYSGVSSVIEMQEYQKEQDMDGNKYYYGITWQEIQEDLFLHGQYCFSDSSVIVISINRYSKGGKTENKYYEIVSGKD